MTSKIEKQKFKEFLKKVEDPKNNSEVNYALPENPTPYKSLSLKFVRKF